MTDLRAQVLLVIILFCFTFVTMVGGNPKHDAYGFRYWNNPVSQSIVSLGLFANKQSLQGAFAEYVTTGSLGRFQGFLCGIWWASFVMTGPEYLSMLSGESKLHTQDLETCSPAFHALDFI